MTFRLPSDGAGEGREWMARIRADDAGAFEQVYHRFYAELCEFANRYVSSPEVAADVVTAVFAKLWESRHQLPDVVHPRHYLLGATRNAAIDEARHERVEAAWRSRVAAGQRIETDVAWNTGEHAVESDELSARVRSLLSGLSPRCRRAFALRWQRQLSYADIAAVLGVSIKAVEKELSRARKALIKAQETLRPYR
jgi:RNA polymerase sigma-70 factor (ECF subfamily)